MTERAPTIASPVVGFSWFGPSAARTYAHVQMGEGLLVKREPTNPADRNAIILQKHYTGEPLGYLTREAAAQMAPWMDKGWVYTCTCIEPAQVRWLGVRMRVRNRTLGVRCVPVAPIALSRVARRTRQLEDVE